ncbi:MAG: Hsp20/alpha crystallin family protein [Spirochaetales bacterium]|nr:MAG: Hsp20/alpha crystallin family protein [Spirochaetales bacterium]
MNSLSLWQDMDRMLDSLFDDTPLWNSRVPSVDIREENDKYILEAELPGLSEKDIEVKLETNLLTISSVKKEEKEEKKNGYLLRERRSSSFCRSFVLPKDADREKLEAAFKNGVLTVELHKNPEAKPRNIEIKAQ